MQESVTLRRGELIEEVKRYRQTGTRRPQSAAASKRKGMATRISFANGKAAWHTRLFLGKQHTQ